MPILIVLIIYHYFTFYNNYIYTLRSICTKWLNTYVFITHTKINEFLLCKSLIPNTAKAHNTTPSTKTYRQQIHKANQMARKHRRDPSLPPLPPHAQVQSTGLQPIPYSLYHHYARSI